MTEAATTTTAADTTAAAATTTAATTAAAPPWHGVTDPDTAAWVETKGWKSTPDVIQSARNAEKLIGRDPSTLISMPRADDPAGLMAVFDKLGRPATADKYEFSRPPEGVNPDASYEAWARGTFHKIGMLPSQVKELTAAHNEYVANTLKQQATDYELKVTTEKADLQREWGGGFERMFAAAKNAAGSLGFTGEMIDAMEQAVGYKGTYKFFANLGQKLGEDGFAHGGTTPKLAGQMTPAEAKVEWDAMKIDPVMSKALTDSQHPAHKQAKAKQASLFSVMYPE